MYYTLNPTCVAKNPDALGAGWHKHQWSLPDFLTRHYWQGQAISTGIYENDKRSIGTWQSSQIFVVDIDHFPNGYDIDTVLAGEVGRYCLIAYPSSSHTAQKPRYHLLFRFAAPVTDVATWKQSVAYITGRIPFPIDSAPNHPAQVLYGTGELPDKARWLRVNEEALPVPLLQVATPDTQQATDVAQHLAYPDDIRESVVVDAVRYAFKGWGRRDYAEWLALVIACYAGSSGYAVRDAILAHPDITWNSAERQDFRRWWAGFSLWQDGGISVATLFAAALSNGWLTETDVDIYSAQTFHQQYLTLPNAPRVLMISDLGTGKTQAAIVAARNTAGRAVFFAPTIKLCQALSTALREAGVENTLYIDDGRTLSKDEMTEARVLVTTLQTFAIKLYKRGARIEDYALAVIDECDQLISAFVRARADAVLGMSSHVTRQQSLWGMMALRDICLHVGRVLLLDGTATRVTLDTVKRWGEFQVWRNTYTPVKAPVHLLDRADSARALCVTRLREKKRVVYVADTKRECRLMYEYVLRHGICQWQDVLMVTADTSHQDKVKQFFQNVDEQAGHYRLILFNSAMGSGVSVVGVEADTVIQVCSYLSPRHNLQMLNRFRRQREVFAYVGGQRLLWVDTPHMKIRAARATVEAELAELGATSVEGGELATAITEGALLSATDEAQQRRDYRRFYTELLQKDGRQVEAWGGLIDDLDGLKEVKAVFKEQKEYVLTNWPHVEPLYIGNPVPQDLTFAEIAAGLLHGYLLSVYGELPDAPPELLGELTPKHVRHVRLWQSVISPDRAIARTLLDAGDVDSALVTRRLQLARVALVRHVGTLFPDVLASVEMDNDSAFEPFLAGMMGYATLYDGLMKDYRKRYSTIMESGKPTPDKALDFVKYIVGGVGLTVSRKSGKRGGRMVRVGRLEGWQDVGQVYEWMTKSTLANPTLEPLQWDKVRLTLTRWGALNQKARADALRAVLDLDTTLEEAVLFGNIPF